MSEKLCKNCKTEVVFDFIEDDIICPVCFSAQDMWETIIQDEKIRRYKYERKNHFSKWLNKMQKKEITVSKDVCEEIERQIGLLTKKQFSDALKDLNLSPHYDDNLEWRSQSS